MSTSFPSYTSRWHWIRPVVWQLGTYAAFWIQLRLLAGLRNNYGPWHPVILAVTAGLLSTFVILYFLHRPAPVALAPIKVATRLGWGGVALLVGGAWALSYQAPIIMSNPIDAGYSDIIPVLQNFVARFRSGEVVYRYITNLPYPLFPNYLPMQWLPYVLPDQLGIDYRWWGLGLLLLLGFGAWQVALAKQPIGWFEFALKALLLPLVFVEFVRHDTSLYAHVMEPTIIAYYCVLAASVLSRSALAQGVALGLCLLSRYSLILWVPLYMVILWREAGRRHTLLVAAIVLTAVFALYVIPYLSKDWMIFPRSLTEYRRAAVGESSRSAGPPNTSGLVFNGLGVSNWFYTYVPGDLAQRIAWLQRIQLLVCSAVVLGFAGLYWRFRHRLDYRIVALVALQFYLMVFYLFIQTPYAYLTSLTPFVSAFLVLAVGGNTLLQRVVPPTPPSNEY